MESHLEKIIGGSGTEENANYVIQQMRKRKKPILTMHQKTFANTDLINAVCYSVYDGDTCSVILDLDGEYMIGKIRLFGIDTPEIRGPKKKPEAAELAKNFLSDKILGKYIQVRVYKKKPEKFGRLLGIIYSPDTDIPDRDSPEKNSLNLALVENDMATLRFSDWDEFE